jgi:phosphoribosylformimino-5-aminoimidazole carboxamide ribotide isomerase
MTAAADSRIDVVPVIDLKAGPVVHARGGRRDEYRPIATPLSPTSAPGDVVAGLLRLFPFRRLYVADLDAIERRGDHAAILAALAAAHPSLDLWVDNGADDLGLARWWLASSPARLVIGSESQTGPDLARALRGDPRVVLSLDFRAEAFQGPAAILEQPDLWPDRVVVMTLARVGAGQGPDVQRIRAVAQRAGTRQVYAAGGVRNAEDLRAVAEAGATGALVATALHEGALSAETLKGIARP